jgi:predicted naringenin-chalcone synthase
MSFAILGVGTARPSTILNQDESMAVARAVCCKTANQASWLPALYRGSGIETRSLAFDPAVIRDILNGTRHTASPFLPNGEVDDRGPTSGKRMQHYREQAPRLACDAARSALERSAVPARRVTHLVTVSCTGFFAPGVDVALVKSLDLNPTIARTHVGFMGCHGALNGLRVADAFTAADANARVLLCAVELCGLHYHYRWDPQKMVANALFADGAAAVVGAPEALAPASAWRMAATASCVMPDSEDAMTWTISDYNFEMTLSKRVPGLVARHLRPWLNQWLDEHHLDVRQVTSWAVHPGGPRILAAVEESLELRPDALEDSKAVLAECGNMSSPTLLFILDRLRRRNAPRPCVALGFGPGLAAEAVLFR